MTKNLNKVKVLTIVFAIILTIFSLCTFASQVSTVYAAEFTYQEGRDGFGLTNDGKLGVTFTVSEMEPGLTSGLIKWGVYLIDPETGLEYNATTHKYEDNNNRQRYVADYYFLIDPNDAYDTNGNQVRANGEATYTMYVNTNAIAYHATSNPSNASDFGTNTGKTMEDVLHEKDWIIGVGPMFENWWTSGYGAPIDYYVGRQSELLVAKVYFRDFDGTLITENTYYDETVYVDVTNVTADANKVFTGWYCDANMQTYNTLTDNDDNVTSVDEILVSDLVTNTKTVNFYATYQRGSGEYIEFTTIANYAKNYDEDNDSVNDAILLDTTDDDTEFTVTYQITHNDGANSILLLPEFDTSVFSIKSMIVDGTTALGTPTITYEGFDKILLESENTYSSLNNAFITITFNIDNPKDGDYLFGLKLAPYVHNEVSESYYWLDGTSIGEQDELDIKVITANSLVRILTLKEAEIVIGYNTEDYYNYYNFIYSGSALTAEQVQSLNTTDPTSVEYTYNGTGTPVVVWYDNYDTILSQAPIAPGSYQIGVSAPANGVYKAVAEVKRDVVISKRALEITVGNKSTVYGEALDKNFTCNISVSGVTASDLSITYVLNDGTDPVNAGNYSIVAVVGNTTYYDVTSNTAGTYTITPRAITITADNQTAQYTGEEPVVDQSRYTVKDTGTEDIFAGVSGVTIVKEAGVNVGSYTLTPSINNTLGNFTITTVNGTFTITSVGVLAEEINSYFQGKTVTYNGQAQDLLIVDSNMPAYITYVANDRMKTSAGDYVITYVATVDANHSITDPENVLGSVNSKILPKALTITADNVGHTYGNTPATLTYSAEGLVDGDQLTVTFVTKDVNEETITITSSTNAGSYVIVPSATNGNYAITLVNGTYTISKATPVINVTANDVYYNRDLDYTASATVASSAVEYSVVIKDANGDPVDPSLVLDKGDYTVEVTVAGTNNYYSATQTAEFEIMPISLANVTITYVGGTVTWTVVTTDAGDTDSQVPAKELVTGTEVVYEINEEEVEGTSYTATSNTALTLTISSNNNNYNPVEVVLEPIYTVSFTDDVNNHAANNANPSNMPAVQYIFNGAKATEPSAPTLNGYTFTRWNKNNVAFDFDSAITANTTLVAFWGVNQLTMTVVYIEEDELTEASLTFTVDYGSTVTVTTANLKTEAGLVDVEDDMATQYDKNGMRYTFGNLWSYKVTGESEYIATEVEDGSVIVYSNYTFVAIYTSAPIEYVLTYMISIDGGDYVAYTDEVIEVAYGATITYLVPTATTWFKHDVWFANEARTIYAPATMPAGDLTVYGATVFDIGLGDINGDGSIDANDITLYRQWIVGGYTMEIVATGDEYQTIQDFDDEARYFITKVADINADTSKDIRDVSITRMAIVGGYAWDNENGYNVTGHEIIKNVNTNILNTIDSAIRAGKKVTLTGNVEEQEGVININTANNVYIDLGGYTLTLDSFNITSTSRSTITIVNGTIVTNEGITISAPYGNVVLTDLVGYDANGLVNLAAASHSLHFNGNVEFYAGTDTTDPEPEPAAINVLNGTHVVVEPESVIVIEKIVVTVENFVEPQQQEEAVITLENYSVVTTEIEVEGNVVISENEIGSYAELVEAASKGGIYTLTADIEYAGQIDFEKDAKLILNGHTLRSTNDVALIAVAGATLEITGNGNVIAQEACVMAFDGSEIVINGGTYTAIDNFVFGTNGTRNRGNNTITINAGVFNGGIQSAGYIACGVYVANNDTVVINGGTFNITNGVGVLARSGNTTISEDVVFVVTGNGAFGKVGDSKVTVPAGEVIVLDKAAAYPGGVPTLTNNSEYTIYTKEVINNLNDLVAAAANGGDYTLMANVAYAGQVSFAEDAILNLNGKTIQSTNNIALSASNGAKLTINGNGNVMAQEACVMAFTGSKVVINGGTYTAIDNFVVGTNGTVKAGDDKGHNEITINAGTFNGGIQSAGYVACGIYVANSDTVVVNGGTFNITNGVGVLARSGNTTIGANAVFNVTGNGTLGKVGDSSVTVPSGKVFVWDLAANYPGGAPVFTNNTNYGVFALVENANELATVNGVANEIKLYGNIASSYAEPIVFVTDTTIILNNYSITSSNDVALRALNGATLVIEGNGNVTAQEACVMAFNGSEVVINGGTYTAIDNFVFGTNGSEGSGNNIITVNGGVFNGGIQSAGYVACGVYVANNDIVYINGGTFNIANGVGVLARSGNTTIGEDVVFNVTGNGAFGKVGDSKVTVPAGAVIVLDKAAAYPGGVPTLTNSSEYTVYTKEGVSTINELKAAALVGGDITLLANMSYEGQVVFSEDAILNLNGKTLRSTNDVAISVVNGAELTITGNGNVIAQEACVMAFDGSEIVINGGTYTAIDNFVIGTNGTNGRGNNTITINAGTFNGGIQTAGYVACGIYVANNDTVVVNAGTFNITNGVGVLARSGNTTINANAVFAVTGNGDAGKVGDSRVVVPTGAVLVLDLAANYPGGVPTLNNNSAYNIHTISNN